MDFSSLPKVELHLHLDCSLSLNVVKKLDPDITKEDYRRFFIAPEKCRDLADYIRRSANAIALMQTKEELSMVVHDLFDQLKDDNVIYAEMRFAPLEHTREGLSAEEVVEIVNQAVEEGISETGIEAGVILCTLRHYSEEQSMQVAKLVEKFNGTHVVAFDIAGDEAGFPIDNNVDAFKYANQKDLNCTAHAGEARGADSVWETLQNFKPSRIGHGVRSSEDSELLEHLKENDIHLEICPKSNIQTNVYDEITDHTIDKLFNSGVSLSVNTDTRTISDVTLYEEYQRLAKIFSWGKEQLLKCNLEAIDHAFTTDAIKKKLRKTISEAYS